MNFQLTPHKNGYALVFVSHGHKSTLIDGKTGEPFIFSKREVHGWNYGLLGTDLGRVMNFLSENENV